MVSLIVNLERACFVACSGCYNHFGKSSPVHSEKLLATLSSLRNLGFNRVTFGGGDPLARDDLVGVLTATKKLGYWVALDTVGTAFIEDSETIFNASRLVKKVSPTDILGLADRVGIPIDGTDQSSASSFRSGRPNLAVEQVAILDALEKAGMPVQVHTVVTRRNLDNVPAISGLLTRFRNIVEWQLFQFMPIGPLGYRNRKKYEISESLFWNCFRTTKDILCKSPFSEIKVTPKSASMRSGAYIIFDSDGVVWRPAEMGSEDLNGGQRIVLGDLRDADGIEALCSLLRRQYLCEANGR